MFDMDTAEWRQPGQRFCSVCQNRVRFASKGMPISDAEIEAE
jgi:hypothetical protein